MTDLKRLFENIIVNILLSTSLKESYVIMLKMLFFLLVPTVLSFSKLLADVSYAHVKMLASSLFLQRYALVKMLSMSLY